MSELISNDAKTENAIDIFIFSNGEQNAPPRKYHLELKEMKMWKGTLRNLGNSHYGVNNADIDIYTTDGKKVEGPAQLCHLKAYVAVIPPCAFIQAGYDNYLIKASRSWEKRMLKITNSIESPSKDQKQTILPKAEIRMKIIETEAQTQKANKVEMKEKTNIRAKANVLKVDPTKTKKLQEYSKQVTKCPIGIKQIKIPFITETTALKTQIFTPFKISTPTKRTIIKAKESLQTKPIAQRKVFPITIKRNIPRSSGTNNNSDKLGEKNIKSSIIDSLNALAKTSENRIQPSVTPRNSKQIQDFETISYEDSNIYKNYDSEIKSVTELKHDEILNENYKNALANEMVSISDKSGYNTSTLRIQDKSSKLSLIKNENKQHIQQQHIELPYSEEKAPNVDSAPSVITCHNCIAKQGSMNNFVAIINNNKMFKLQLNIDIQNDILPDNNGDDLKKRHSIKSILKEEKEIQVNLYEEANVARDHAHAHFSKCDLVKNVSDEGKIIIIHCSCFNDIDLNSLLQSHINHNQVCQYEFKPELSEEVEEKRCDCEALIVEPKEIQTVNEFSEAHIVAKMSEHKIGTSDMEFKRPSILEKETKHESEISTYPTSEDNKLDFFISRHTQTNWCSIIVQAVCHEGGRYSLHLPPLQTIKNLNHCCE